MSYWKNFLYRRGCKCDSMQFKLAGNSRHTCICYSLRTGALSVRSSCFDVFIKIQNGNEKQWKKSGRCLHEYATLHRLLVWIECKVYLCHCGCFDLNKPLSDQMNMCDFGLVNAMQYSRYASDETSWLFFTKLRKHFVGIFQRIHSSSFAAVCQVTN